MLLGEQGADEADDRGAVGEDADDVGATANLLRRRMPAVTLDRLDAE